MNVVIIENQTPEDRLTEIKNELKHEVKVEIAEDKINPLSPKIDFYVDLLICATSWASNHNFMLLSKIFQDIIYDNISPCPFKRTLGLRGYMFFSRTHYTAIVILITV